MSVVENYIKTEAKEIILLIFFSNIKSVFKIKIYANFLSREA